MLSKPDGSRIDVNTNYGKKGIVRSNSNDGSCTYMESWRMYKCTNMKYKMLMIENLDKDTETRRLSPIAVASQGYVDLINGPQDHGWCHGYTCQERISTFAALVATGLQYEIHMTSYNPQATRLTMLNAEKGDAVLVEIYYSKPERLDVYRDGEHVIFKASFYFRLG